MLIISSAFLLLLGVALKTSALKSKQLIITRPILNSLSSGTFDEIVTEDFVINPVGLNINFDADVENIFYNSPDGNFESDDPYGDILNLRKPLAPQNSSLILSASTILASSEEQSSTQSTYSTLIGKRNPTGLLSNFKRWEHWDAFMEAELGDIDAELKDSERWIQEMRDYVEQKRGFAIWSKRTDKDIQKEMKKSLASRGMVIPMNVAMVITAVYLEKSHTMKALKDEEELACLEFRKWVMEQKKKNKKDPITSAKVEVSKNWIMRHPSSSSSGLFSTIGKKGKAIIRKKPLSALPYVKKGPSTLVVLDEVATVTSSTATTSSDPVSAATAKSGPPLGFAPSSPSSSPLPPTHSLMTPSVQNWSKSAAELLSSPSNPSGESDSPDVGAGYRPSKGNVIEIFKVEETAMYIPNYCAPNSDYYVVL